MSIFDSYRSTAWPYRFTGQLLIDCIAGGVPSDPKVTEGWLRSKLADKDDLIRDLVAQTVVDRGVDVEQAIELVDALKHLTGFKRDEHGLYIEGRQLKAALKEAAMVAANAGKLPAAGWGSPGDKRYLKGIKQWFPEHVFVMEDRLHLGVSAPTDTLTRFVHARQQAAIKSFEIVEQAKVEFTVVTDHAFTEQEWAMIWLTGEQQGIGADRSQGMGRYTVTRWEPAP